VLLANWEEGMLPLTCPLTSVGENNAMGILNPPDALNDGIQG
jgi:hypothetical protein